jgi:hypothetical protein
MRFEYVYETSQINGKSVKITEYHSETILGLKLATSSDALIDAKERATKNRWYLSSIKQVRD